MPRTLYLVAYDVCGDPRRLAQVAVYAIESPDNIAFGTVAGVAAEAKVQPSTLVRFAKALGYGRADFNTGDHVSMIKASRKDKDRKAG